MILADTSIWMDARQAIHAAAQSLPFAADIQE
jgi:hypothetical protein